MPRADTILLPFVVIYLPFLLYLMSSLPGVLNLYTSYILLCPRPDIFLP